MRAEPARRCGGLAREGKSSGVIECLFASAQLCRSLNASMQAFPWLVLPETWTGNLVPSFVRGNSGRFFQLRGFVALLEGDWFKAQLETDATGNSSVCWMVTLRPRRLRSSIHVGCSDKYIWASQVLFRKTGWAAKFMENCPLRREVHFAPFCHRSRADLLGKGVELAGLRVP